MESLGHIEAERPDPLRHLLELLPLLQLSKMPVRGLDHQIAQPAIALRRRLENDLDRRRERRVGPPALPVHFPLKAPLGQLLQRRHLVELAHGVHARVEQHRAVGGRGIAVVVEEHEQRVHGGRVVLLERDDVLAGLFECVVGIAGVGEDGALRADDGLVRRVGGSVVAAHLDVGVEVGVEEAGTLCVSGVHVGCGVVRGRADLAMPTGRDAVGSSVSVAIAMGCG